MFAIEIARGSEIFAELVELESEGIDELGILLVSRVGTGYSWGLLARSSGLWVGISLIFTAPELIWFEGVKNLPVEDGELLESKRGGGGSEVGRWP